MSLLTYDCPCLHIMCHVQYHTILVFYSLARVIALAKKLANYNKHHLHKEGLKGGVHGLIQRWSLGEFDLWILLPS